MSDKSGIQWTDATWNPVTGCDKVSQGCKNCYAEKMAERLQKMGAPKYANGFAVTLHEKEAHLFTSQPYRWTRPRRIFVNSMSDLFHHAVPTAFIEKVFSIMCRCPQHQFQILTKRAERLRSMGGALPWAPNIWMGVSIESSEHFDRVAALSDIPAAVRFLSCEPLLGSLIGIDLNVIDWVIVGGESGPKSRPMDPQWARELRDLCVATKTPFFFKQWGTTNKKAAGRLLDGVEYSEFPAGEAQ